MIFIHSHKLHVENSIGWNDKPLNNSDGQMELLEQHCSDLEKINKLGTYFTSTGTTFRSYKVHNGPKVKTLSKDQVCMHYASQDCKLTCTGKFVSHL